MMPSLLEAVLDALDRRQIRCALIGAGALAVRGVARSTFDLDLLVTNPAVLSAQTWSELEAAAICVEIRRGGPDDPLAGVVRLAAPAERPVDVIVGRLPWQADAIERAERISVGALQIAVVRAADLVLLKLYAGGSQDAWDITQLLAGDDRETLVAEVASRLDVLPADARAAWQRLLG